jgi:hypothetical protein
MEKIITVGLDLAKFRTALRLATTKQILISLAAFAVRLREANDGSGFPTESCAADRTYFLINGHSLSASGRNASSGFTFETRS